MLADLAEIVDPSELARQRREVIRQMARAGRNVQQVAEAVGLSVDYVRTRMRDITPDVVVPVKPPKDPASYALAGNFCRPCQRRVLPTEARGCKHDCAAKRMATA